MEDPTIIFRVHAIQQMFSRGVSEVEVRAVLEDDDTIEGYPDEKPYPARLLLGFVAGRPIHVVAAFDASSDTIIVITVYEPDPARWTDRFRRRKPP